MDTFWLNDPTILLNKHYLLEIWPDSELSMERKLNAITRLIILLTCPAVRVRSRIIEICKQLPSIQ